MTTLRWGILGTARINRSLIPPLRASRRNELSAVASRRLEVAKGYAKDWGIPRALGSYEALVADPEIDVLYIPLPNSLHAEWTIRGVEAGKHVLCEKPLALTVEDVDAVAAAARKAGVIVAEAFMYRHHPQTRKVEELVKDGAIGTLRLVRGSFTFSLTRERDVRLDPALGGGSLWDVGGYPIGYGRLLAGAEPVEVVGWQVLGPTGVDEGFTGQLRFPDGVHAQIDSGFRVPHRTSVEVVGSEGTITVPQAFKPKADEPIVLVRGDDVERIEVPGDLYLGEVEDMADAVLRGKAPCVSLADSRGNVATIVALLLSAHEGRPVKL